MKQNFLIVILLLCFGISGYTFYTAYQSQNSTDITAGMQGQGRMMPVADENRVQVDLDTFSELRPRSKGTRDIGPLNPITFNVTVKQAPEPISTRYLQEAFGVLRIAPAPKVTHQMFVETAQGKVISVYVWDTAVDQFTAGPDLIQMLGFHVYTYSKGPAIIVDGAI